MLQKLDIQNFDLVYQLMEESFPPDERRTYAGQKALLRETGYTIYTYEEKGVLVGFLATWTLDTFMFLEHFAVNPAYRNRGLGQKLLGALFYLAERRLCLEVEPPNTELAKRRIGFYERNGFSLNLYPYMQPPLSPGKQPVPLLIMTSSGPVCQEIFDKIKSVLYNEVYRKGVGYT